MDDFSVQLHPDEPVYAPSDFQSAQRVEAETLPLNKAEGPGTNGTVSVVGGLAQASNTAGISLYDIGDKITLNFTANQTGTHKLKVRLRSGNASNQKANINGYGFKLDGQPLVFTDDGVGYVNDPSHGAGITWGTLSSEALVLQSGPHTLEITAIQPWLFLDYLETFVQNAFEAESPVNEVFEAGENNIGATSGFEQAGNGTAVWLHEPGDAIRIDFNVPQAGNHVLKVRVRSGYPSNDRAYFNNGYAFKVDGQTVAFTGDAESIVRETKTNWMGNTVWGTMVSPVRDLAAGAHSIEIAAVLSTGQVDYLESYLQKVVEAEVLPLDSTEGSGSTNGLVGVTTGFNLASGGGAVWLNDIGDILRLNFTVTRPGNHILKLRVRAGSPSVDRGYFSNGYSCKVNGQAVIFTGDLESIIQETKPGWMSDTVWGTMSSPILNLPAGLNQIEIKAESPWTQVDCLEPRLLEPRW
ncbi:MAG: hypothetical protein Q8Q59_10865 [Luteolibacter sp.]|nr:hypothetical protein [Luteolibacter sp.]